MGTEHMKLKPRVSLLVSQSHFQLEKYAYYFLLTPKFSKHFVVTRKLNDKPNISDTTPLVFRGNTEIPLRGRKHSLLLDIYVLKVWEVFLKSGLHPSFVQRLYSSPAMCLS